MNKRIRRDKQTAPPALAAFLLARLSRSEDRRSILGDFAEIYEESVITEGCLKARRRYWSQVLRSIPLFIINQFHWGAVMLKNYLKIALRNIKKHKGYSFINIFGLAVGIACCILILSWVRGELSVDRFHQDPGTIYHVLTDTDIKNNSVSPTPLAPLLKQKYPEIVDAARFHWFWGETVLSYNDTTFTENRIRLVDPSFLNIFNFPFIEGDPETALQDTNSIVITKAVAEKYFGEHDPIGKVFKMNRQHPLTVTGVIENVPGNSTLRFDMLIPIQFNITNYDDWYMYWQNFNVYTFIKCRDNCNIKDLAAKIAGVVRENGGGKDVTLSLLPFVERYFLFYSDKTMIYAFLTIALFILLIACFNFMNLSTARSAMRANEIGMRKIVGATRKQMIFQFLGESVLLSLTAGIFAGILIYLLLPLFNMVTRKAYVFQNSFIIFGALAAALAAGLIAGSYPAFFLSNFKVMKVLKNNVTSGFKGAKLRKGIVVLQFVISILLIFSMMVVHQQMNYVKHRDIGYNKNNLVSIPMGGGSEKYYRVFKNELLRDARISGATGTASSLPFFTWHQGGYQWQGKDPEEKISLCFNAVDFDFAGTMQLELLEGRDFSKEFPADADTNFLVNEAMAKLMGVKSVVGATLTQAGDTGKIVGLVRDFHFSSLRNQIEPLLLKLQPQSIDNVLVRLNPGNNAAAVSFIEKTWKKVIPGYPFRYSFIDEEYHESVTDLSRAGYLLSGFSILAIIISCLGLFGLSSYAAERRTKEIGIRKVFGASLSSIIKLISREFVILVLIADIFVWPLAYFIMKGWLQGYAYRAELTIWPFILSGISALIIALSAVSYQAVKAAAAHPIDSLRYE